MSYSCYCLLSETGSSYVGCTNNLNRRLRQHNGEITGGARATKGKAWTRILSVTGFPDQQSALQFEWAWKFHTRKLKGTSAVDRRCTALSNLLQKEQSTSKANPFSSYESPLLILVDDPRCHPFLRDKEMTYGILVE